MPTYKLTDQNTGRTIKVSGDTPPTEEEVSKLFEDTRLDAIKSMESKLYEPNLPDKDRKAIGEKYVNENAEYKKSKGLTGRAADMISETDIPGAAKNLAVSVAGQENYKKELEDLGVKPETATIPQKVNAYGYALAGRVGDALTYIPKKIYKAATDTSKPVIQRTGELGTSLAGDIGEAATGAVTGVADLGKMVHSGAQKLIAETPNAFAAGTRAVVNAAQPDAPRTVAIDTNTGKEVDLDTLVTPDGKKLSEVVEPAKPTEGLDPDRVAAQSDLDRINQSVAYEKAAKGVAKAATGSEPGAIFEVGRVAGGFAVPVSIPGVSQAAGVISKAGRKLVETGAKKTLGAAMTGIPRAAVLAADTVGAGAIATQAAIPKSLYGWLAFPTEAKAAAALIGDNSFNNLGRFVRGVGEKIPEGPIGHHTGFSRFARYVGDAVDKARTAITENSVTGAGSILMRDLDAAGATLMENGAKRVGEIMGRLEDPVDLAKLTKDQQQAIRAEQQVLRAEKAQVLSHMASIEAGKSLIEKMSKLPSLPEPLADALSHSVVGATIGTGLAAATSTPGQENVLGQGAAGGAFYGAILSQLGKAALTLKKGKPGEAKTLTPEDIDTIVNSKEFADKVKGMTEETVKAYEGPKGVDTEAVPPPPDAVLARKPGPSGLPELIAAEAPKEPIAKPAGVLAERPAETSAKQAEKVLAPKAEPEAASKVTEPEIPVIEPAAPELMPSQARALEGLQTELPMKISSKKTPALTAARSELQKLSDKFEALDKKYAEEGLTPVDEDAYEALRLEVESKTAEVAKLEAKEVKKAKRLRVDTEPAPESAPAVEKQPAKLTQEEIRTKNEANYAKWQEGRDAWVDGYAKKLGEQYTDPIWAKAEALKVWEKNRYEQAKKAFGEDSQLAEDALADYNKAADDAFEIANSALVESAAPVEPAGVLAEVPVETPAKTVKPLAEKAPDVTGVEPVEEAALSPRQFTEADVHRANLASSHEITPEELNSRVEKFRSDLTKTASVLVDVPAEISTKIEKLTDMFVSDIRSDLAWKAKNPGMMAAGPAANKRSSKYPEMSVTKDVLAKFEQNVNGALLRRKAELNAPKREAALAKKKESAAAADESVKAATKASVGTADELISALKDFSKSTGRTQQKASANAALKLIKEKGVSPTASTESIQGLYDDIASGKAHSNHLPNVVKF